jgi:translocation and assembly module TamB
VTRRRKRSNRLAALRGGPELGRIFAGVVLFLLVLVGGVAVALPFTFRVPRVRAWIEAEVAQVVKSETGLDVRVSIDRALWPPGVLVRDIEVASTTPGRPALRAAEARATLRPFSLLSGKVVVDTIEVVAPEIDLELDDGKPANLPLRLASRPDGPKSPSTEPPFRVLAITGAKVRLQHRTTGAPPVALELAGIDFDVDVSAASVPVYEVRLHKARGAIHSTHRQGNRLPLPDRFVHADFKKPWTAYDSVDDDAICAVSLSAKITDAPTTTTIDLRKLELDARLDDDRTPGAPPSCESAVVSGERLVSLRLDGFAIELPKAPADPASKAASPRIVAPPSGGRIRVRAPTALPYRYVQLDPLGGWIGLDVDVVASIDLADPALGLARATATGRIEGHDLRYSYFRFGSSLQGDVFLKAPLTVGSQKLEVAYGDGLVTLTDVEVGLAPAPFAKKRLPLKANVAIRDMSFPGLMRELGVSSRSHVRWDVRDATARVTGHLDPFALDGELVAKTRNFELAERPVEGPNPGHVIGLSAKTGGNAELNARVAVRETFLAFDQVRASFGGTRLGGRVLIGFDDRLEVDVAGESVDLADASPLSTFPIAGVGKVDLKLRGTYDRFVGEGAAAFSGFVFDQFALGDIERATYRFDDQSIVEVSGLEAKHGESRFEVPSMRVDLGRQAESAIVDALATSKSMALEELYEIFQIKGDPRWDEIRGSLGFDARAHFVAGGPNDPCGGGKLDLDLVAHVRALDLFGERFDGGTADVALVWWDFDGGGLGLDLDVHAATLRKKGGGTVVASGGIRRGGNLNMKVTASGVSLRGLSAMPTTTIPVEGTVDAVAEVFGTFDTMRIAADVDVSPIRVADQRLEGSRMRITREPVASLAPSIQPDARGCFPKTASEPFDPVKWAADLETGEIVVRGDLFGATVKLDPLRITDQRKKVARGSIALRGVDLAPLSLIRPERAEVTLGAADPEATTPIGVSGRASADVTLTNLPFDAWWDAVGSIEGLTLDVARGDLGIATVGQTPPIRFGKDGFSLPRTSLSLRFGEVPTRVVVAARVARKPDDAGSPDLAASIELPTIPLARLEEFLPRNIERAEGTARARLKVGGTLASPTWDGELAVENGAFAFKAISMPLVGVNGVVKIDPKRGITIEKLHGELGGGTVELTGGAALRGLDLGDLDVKIRARDVHFRYGEGFGTTFGADLRATWSPAEPGLSAEPARLEGLVDIESFLYEKRVGFGGLDSFTASRRTEVEVYDPARDLLAFDIEVRSRRGFRIRNNLVDATLAIGQTGLRAVGTNQRYGMLGELYVVTGGTFKFRRHDFEIREGRLRFERETEIDPVIDVTAVTEFRRAASVGSSVEWRIKLHAYGTKDDLKLDLSSEPPLSQEDLILLLTIGMTKAESAQIGGNVAGGAGLDLLANVTGVNETLSQAIPVIDDIRFGTAYSLRTGRTEPQITLGKRLSDSLRASVTTGVGENPDRQANIEWRLSRRFSIRGSYDNANDLSSRGVGNVGADLRYRIEFE